jgi:hypothetical protein
VGLERDDLVQALGLSFTVSTVALAADLAPPLAASGASFLALLLALAGMILGGQVRPETFRLYLFLELLALGGD